MELEGRIGFCVSAVVEPALREALYGVKETAWKTFDMEADGTLRHWGKRFCSTKSIKLSFSQNILYLAISVLTADQGPRSQPIKSMPEYH